MQLSRPHFLRRTLHLVAPVTLALLAACGDDDDTTAAAAAPMLSGIAAAGAPIVGGTVDLHCAGGADLSTTTGADGAWQIASTGQTLPCAVRVSGGTAAGLAQVPTYHAFAFDFGTPINLTALSDLTVARTVGLDPAAWYATPAFNGVNAAAAAAAWAEVKAALGLGSALGSTDPLSATFTPAAGDPIDDLLEKLRLALQALSLEYSALLVAAGNGNFSAFAGLPAAIAAATVGGGGGGSVACSGAAVEATFAAQASGAPYSNGQKLCITASPTSLALDGKTLTNPVQNTVLTAPFAGYTFSDGSLAYEVVLKNGALYEVNLLSGSNFLGQFSVAAAPSAGTLSVEVAISGQAPTSFEVPDVAAPSSEAEFCAEVANDVAFAAIQGQAGATLTIASCSFANNTGVVNANATTSGFSVPYVVTFRYRP